MSNKVAIVDYGVGNLFSLQSSLAYVGADCERITEPEKLKNYKKILLPGVGAFEDASKKLKDTGMGQAVCECAKNGADILGICLGMQLLFDKSHEFGEHEGLGLIPGSVRPIKEMIPDGLKIPHIGWNKLKFGQPEKIFSDSKEGDFVYFVHSYAAVCDSKYITSYTEYGGILTASVRCENVAGTQFHPEKSGDVGLKMLSAFANH